MKLRDVVTICIESINPKKYPNDLFLVYSLPSFDFGKKPEKESGKDIDSNKLIVPSKCILFNKLNVRFKRVWRIYNDGINNKVCSGEFYPLIVNEELVDFNYLFFLLISDKTTSYLCGPTTNTSGSHKRIDSDFLLDMEIKLPSLEEQRKIGTFLNNIFTRVSINKEIIDKSELFLIDLFNYWFNQYHFDEKPLGEDKLIYNNEIGKKIPLGWKCDKLGNYIEIFRGVSYKPEQAHDTKAAETTLLLRSNNIFEGKINYDQVLYVDNSCISSDQMLMPGEIFICMSNGSKDLIGKNATSYSNLPVSFGAFCAKIKAKDSNYTGYINMIFKSSYFKTYVSQICANTSINNLGNDMINDLLVIVPSFDLLQRFQKIYLDIFVLCQKAHNDSICLDSIKNNLINYLVCNQIKFKNKESRN